MWAKIRGVVVGSIKRGSAIRKRRVMGGVLFARDGIEKPEDSSRIRTGRQVRTGGLPGEDLALEMTEDALREASMYLSRCDSDRFATERALRRTRTADSASWDHQALGGRPRRPKGIEALAASIKKREKKWAAWWMLSASKSREGRCSAI